MKKLVFIGSHLGYPMDSTPLGGGAMVGLQLVRHWTRRKDFKLISIGSGAASPDPNAEYIPIRTHARDGLVGLSELGYARFCREFEHRTTGYLADHATLFPVQDTVVVLNDISEGPDAARIAQLGYPILSIWHVDVVDFFNKMYLRDVLEPHRLTRAFDWLGRIGMNWAVPDLLRLVFEKQHRTVQYSRLMAVPSRRMSETIARCYGRISRGFPRHGPAQPLESRLLVVPWGGWSEQAPDPAVQQEVRRLRTQYRLGPQTRALITLSRISPEKGLHLLLEALRLLEASPDFPAQELCLFLCGEPAFMRGGSYARRVHAEARRLRRCRVFFPGYLSPIRKQAHFRLSNLFISPSIHESYGLSNVEALRAGLPILASDHSGV
ncbi:MAG: glycosyltransferase, partial [Elusimicrobia bacterium]|nr:glycosyltransferase [Elusimicrobiota bacterium]